MSQKFMSSAGNINKDMIDKAARIAALAKNEKVSSAQLANIQEVMLTEGDERTCFLITAAFVLRQSSRMRRGQNMSREMARQFYEMYNDNFTRESGLVFLGLVKWMYEALRYGGRVNNFKDFLKAAGVREV